MNEWSDEAFAGYLAAMIDGEGHIEIPGTRAVRVRIANTVRPTLVAMQSRLGFGSVIEYRGREHLGYKRLFCLEISSCKNCGYLFQLCGEYIHMKRPAMKAALKVIDGVLAAGDKVDRRNRAILQAIGGARTQAQIARDFGVSPQLVSYIKKGGTWKSVIADHRSRQLAKKFPRTMSQVFRLHGEPE